MENKIIVHFTFTLISKQNLKLTNLCRFKMAVVVHLASHADVLTGSSRNHSFPTIGHRTEGTNLIRYSICSHT